MGHLSLVPCPRSSDPKWTYYWDVLIFDFDNNKISFNTFTTFLFIFCNFYCDLSTNSFVQRSLLFCSALTPLLWKYRSIVFRREDLSPFWGIQMWVFYSCYISPSKENTILPACLDICKRINSENPVWHDTLIVSSFYDLFSQRNMSIACYLHSNE